MDQEFHPRGASFEIRCCKNQFPGRMGHACGISHRVAWGSHPQFAKSGWFPGRSGTGPAPRGENPGRGQGAGSRGIAVITKANGRN